MEVGHLWPMGRSLPIHYLSQLKLLAYIHSLSMYVFYLHIGSQGVSRQNTDLILRFCERLSSQNLKMYFARLSVTVLLCVYANLLLNFFQIRTQYHFYDKTKTESKFQSTTTGSTPITAAQKSSWRQNQTNLASTESGQQNIKSEKVTPSNYVFANKVKLNLFFSFFFDKHIRPYIPTEGLLYQRPKT